MEDHKEHEYWQGTKNKLIRYYFYMSRGLDLFNNFRYIFMAIFGLYLVLKLKNALWLLAMLGISVPMLMVIGYYSIHHIGKIVDWLNVRFSTHYSLLQITLLEEIRDEIKCLKKS